MLLIASAYPYADELFLVSLPPKWGWGIREHVVHDNKMLTTLQYLLSYAVWLVQAASRNLHMTQQGNFFFCVTSYYWLSTNQCSNTSKIMEKNRLQLDRRRVRGCDKKAGLFSASRNTSCDTEQRTAFRA